MTDRIERMSLMAMAHLRGTEPVTVGVLAASDYRGPIVTVKVGYDLHLLFERPEALSGFLLAIAESPDAQQFLAQAGAGFSLTVEPLPLPVGV